MDTTKFASTFLKKEDITGPILVTVDKVTVEKLGDDEKVTIWPAEDVSPFTLNKTNLMKAWEIFGSKDGDEWCGKQIVVYVDPKVIYQGRQVGGIAVRAPKGGQKPSGKAKGTQVANAAPDDDVPF